jgi:hypothetical protein
MVELVIGGDADWLNPLNIGHIPTDGETIGQGPSAPEVAQGKPRWKSSPVTIPRGEERQRPLTGHFDPEEVNEITPSPGRQSVDSSRTSLGCADEPHSSGGSVSRVVSAPAPDVGDEPVVSPEVASLLEGHGGPPSSEDEKTPRKRKNQKTPRKKKNVWKAFSGEAPPGFYKTPLQGEQWEIALALSVPRILTGNTPRALKNKVEKGDVLWGEASGRSYFVYVHYSFRAEQLERALAELDQIRARGPYRPERHPLPRAYRRHERHPLETRSEAVLARVLHQGGILDKPTVRALHNKMQDEGSLFGKYHDDGVFTIYFHSRYSEEEITRMISSLPVQEEP